MHWRRKWQPTPIFLPGESQGRGSLVGCRLWGCRVRHDWSDLAAAAAAVKASKYPFIIYHLTNIIHKHLKTGLCVLGGDRLGRLNFSISQGNRTQSEINVNIMNKSLEVGKKWECSDTLWENLNYWNHIPGKMAGKFLHMYKSKLVRGYLLQDCMK